MKHLFLRQDGIMEPVLYGCYVLAAGPWGRVWGTVGKSPNSIPRRQPENPYREPEQISRESPSRASRFSAGRGQDGGLSINGKFYCPVVGIAVSCVRGSSPREWVSII